MLFGKRRNVEKHNDEWYVNEIDKKISEAIKTGNTTIIISFNEDVPKSVIERIKSRGYEVISSGNRFFKIIW